jgi:CheY-like chemotaxis protein
MNASPARSILVADDNRFNRALVTRHLRQIGLDCLEAGSGEEALQVLRSHDCALVLLDLRMPDRSGESVCTEIRATPALAGLRVIAFTAHRMADEEPQLREAGFDGVLVKPASLHDLRAVCTAHLS